MKTSLIALVLIFIILPLIDTLLYMRLKRLFTTLWRIYIYIAHSFLFLFLLFFLLYTLKFNHTKESYVIFNNIVGAITLVYFPKLIYLFLWGCIVIFRRYYRLYFVLHTIVVVITLYVFFYIGYTVTLGRYNYKEHVQVIEFPTLPKTLNGLKIVQLSDLHLGSHSVNFPGIQKMIEQINRIRPDLILFTGDMINNYGNEITPWIDLLRTLHAKYGKYAVTGNHDYGLYTQWENDSSFKANQKLFFKNMKLSGFTMLNNDYAKIVIRQDTLYLAGVENWGNPPFPRYGNLQYSLRDQNNLFTIVMSHDPSHWQQEIRQNNIPLTLSGHTHAMQIGIEIGKIKWSPAEYLYAEYDGLYKSEEQYLNVNRGQGYLGYPGRIGLVPQIDIIILRNETID